MAVLSAIDLRKRPHHFRHSIPYDSRWYHQLLSEDHAPLCMDICAYYSYRGAGAIYPQSAIRSYHYPWSWLYPSWYRCVLVFSLRMVNHMRWPPALEYGLFKLFLRISVICIIGPLARWHEMAIRVTIHRIKCEQSPQCRPWRQWEHHSAITITATIAKWAQRIFDMNGFTLKQG